MGIDKLRTPDVAPSSETPGGDVWQAGNDWERAGSPGTVVEARRQQSIDRNEVVLGGPVCGRSLLLVSLTTGRCNRSWRSRAFPRVPVRFP